MLPIVVREACAADPGVRPPTCTRRPAFLFAAYSTEFETRLFSEPQPFKNHFKRIDDRSKIPSALLESSEEQSTGP